MARILPDADRQTARRCLHSPTQPITSGQSPCEPWLPPVENQRNLASFDKVFKRQTEPPNRGWLGFLINPTSEWYWRCLVQPRLFQTGAVVALIFSVVLTWSEVGDNVARDLS